MLPYNGTLNMGSYAFTVGIPTVKV